MSSDAASSLDEKNQDFDFNTDCSDGQKDEPLGEHHTANNKITPIKETLKDKVANSSCEGKPSLTFF